MRHETRKKLDAQRSGERWLIVLVGSLFTLIGTFGYLAWTVPFGPSREATGIVRHRVRLTNHETQKQTMKLEVLLDDGRYALATRTFRAWPDIGSRVLLREEISWIGYHHFYWDGLTPQQPKATS